MIKLLKEGRPFIRSLEAESRRGRRGNRSCCSSLHVWTPDVQMALRTFRRSSGRSDGAPEVQMELCWFRRSSGGARQLLRSLNLSVQTNRPLTRSPRLFLGIKAAGSMCAYGNRSVGQTSSEPPRSWVRRWPTGRSLTPTSRLASVFYRLNTNAAQTYFQQVPPAKFKPKLFGFLNYFQRSKISQSAAEYFTTWLVNILNRDLRTLQLNYKVEIAPQQLFCYLTTSK